MADITGYKISQLPILNALDENAYVEVIVPNGSGGFINQRIQLALLEGLNGLPGAAGQSAYQLAVAGGFVGSQAEWLESLVGRSAYEVAVELGYAGTEEEWVTSLIGKSAYQSALDAGFVGTEEEWVESLQGQDGQSAYEGAVAAGYEGTELEFYQRLASGQGVNGGVFITDITPLVGDNVGDKVYDEDGTSLISATATGTTVRVAVLAITGNTRYRPRVTVNGLPVTLTTGADKPLFTGLIDIEIPEGGEIVAEHEDGATWTATIQADLPPVITLAQLSSPYPGAQTELKENDAMSLMFNTDVDVVGYEVADYGMFKASSNTFTATSDHTLTGLLVANRGTSPQTLGFRFRVRKANGTWSAWYTSTDAGNVELTDVAVLNNLYPTIAIGTITYPVDQTALKGSEQATVANVVTNFDTIQYDSPNSQVAFLGLPQAYETDKVVMRNGGTYNIATANFRITAVRAANGAQTVQTAVVRIADVMPVISISTPAARLRSGGNNGTTAQNHTITLTSTQALSEPPSVNAPEGTWLGNWVGNGASTVWTRQLQVHDDDAKGQFSWNSLIARSLSGQEQTAINAGVNYTIGGFVFRTLTVPAFPNREVAIGTEVVTTAKLRCSNLSKGASGSLNFLYQPSTDNAADRYTIINGDTWYNCDGANASSNSGGTMQIELEETV